MADLLVLCYHAVSHHWPAPLSVTPERMHAQLELLVSRGFVGATFSDAVCRPAKGRRLVVSFDDSFRSVLELGKPVLDDLGLPGTVFVPTAYAGTGVPMSWPGIDLWMGTEHEPELMPLSWSELAGLVRSGWEVGSHTRTHPRLTQIDDKQLEAQLVESKSDCEAALGLPCRSLAYPYGDHDQRVVEATRRAGYDAAATLPESMHQSSSHRWPRVGVYQRDDLRRFKLKVSPLSRKLRSSQGWDAMNKLRRR